MPNTIDQAFITQYDSDVHVAYQQYGSKFRNTVRLKTIVPGKTCYFQKLGTGVATQKARNGDVVPMNPTHTNVSVTPADWYAPEYVDKLDELKTNIDERMLMARLSAAALGRKIDTMVTDVLDAVTTLTISSGSTSLNKWKLLQALEYLNDADVPDDGDRWGALGAQQFEEFVNITQVSSRDYVNDLNWLRGTPIISWRNVKWFMHSNLPLSSTTRSVFVYHRTAIGLGENKAISTEINYVPPKASYLINSMLSAGAIVIDENGIVKISCDESATTLLG